MRQKIPFRVRHQQLLHLSHLLHRLHLSHRLTATSLRRTRPQAAQVLSALLLVEPRGSGRASEPRLELTQRHRIAPGTSMRA